MSGSGPDFWVCVSGWLVAFALLLRRWLPVLSDALFPDELIADDEPDRARSHVHVTSGPVDWDHRGWA